MGSYRLSNALAFVLLVLILSSCSSARFTRKATYDKEAAKAAILELNEQPLVVVLPTEGKKIKILRGNGKNKEADRIQADIDELNGELVKVFSTSFDFTEVLFMPDTLVRAYEKGEEDMVILDIEGNLIAPPSSIGRMPYKLILYDYRAFEIIRANNLINHPFPNRFRVQVDYPGGLNIFTQIASLLDTQAPRPADLVPEISKTLVVMHQYHNGSSLDVRSDLKSAQ